MPGLSAAVKWGVLYGTAVLALMGWERQAWADLRFGEKVADAGEIRSGPIVTHAFPFVNEGPEPVRILELRTTCGCLVPRLDKREYGPGESGVLVLEVNTLSEPAGPHAWRVQVGYQRGSQPSELSLQLNARLITEVTVQPAAMTVFADRAIAHEVLVTDLRPKPLAVTGVRTSSPQLTARLGEAGSDTLGHWTRPIHVELAEDYPDGRHQEVLVIATDDPGYREMKVPVTIVKRARQSVSAAPAEVTLSAAAGQPLPSRIVLIRAANEQPVAVERIAADDPAISCQWAAGPNHMATVKISVDRNQLRDGQLQSAVHVQVTQPVRETLTIPVSARTP